jgi:hypothetical protein
VTLEKAQEEEIARLRDEVAFLRSVVKDLVERKGPVRVA